MSNKNLEFDPNRFRKQMNKFKTVQPKYEKFAEVLENILEQGARKYAPLAIVQTRPKSISSFAEKILRRKYTNPIKQMTDLCGGRIITNTQSEIKVLSKFIESHFEIDWQNSVDISQRHKPTEFGYRSVHYIISFKPNMFPTAEINIKIPKMLYNLKAEIQIRTFLEHAWADIYHDVGYKGEFKIPTSIERELAATSALLENADKNFSNIIERLRTYKSSYGAYLTKDQIQDKIKRLEMVLEIDKNNFEIAGTIGKLALAIEDWNKAINILSEYENIQHAIILKTLGIAYCKKYRRKSNNRNFKKGQKLLLTAGSPPHNDSDALSSLAGSWKGINDNKAAEYYRQAYELDPTDPYPLGNYLEFKIANEKKLLNFELIKPIINTAIKRCKAYIEVDVNIPWAYYDIGKFNLLLGRPYDSFSAYAKAIDLSTASFMVETSHLSLIKLGVIKKLLLGYDWIDNLFKLGLTVKHKKIIVKQSTHRRIIRKNRNVNLPVVILVGGF